MSETRCSTCHYRLTNNKKWPCRLMRDNVESNCDIENGGANCEHYESSGGASNAESRAFVVGVPKIELDKVFAGMKRAELEQELAQCSDQLVNMQTKIDSLEKSLAEEKAHSKKIIENAVELMVHGRLCEKHRTQVREMSFDAFVEKQNKDGCPWCSVERVAYLEGILDADGSFTRCHDCGAYVHERDNDWMIDDENHSVCEECEEKRQDAEGDDHG